MTRSFWRVPRADWLTTDEDGNTVQAFGNVVIFDESPQFLYVIAAEEERPDIEAVGTLLGQSVRGLTTADQARFLRVEVDRDTPDGTTRVQVKPGDRRPEDVDVRTNVPAVIWMGDDLADYAP